jgi:hypothetical protein
MLREASAEVRPPLLRVRELYRRPSASWKRGQLIQRQRLCASGAVTGVAAAGTAATGTWLCVRVL